jgi:membrane protease YdiL (CAAX protease family)
MKFNILSIANISFGLFLLIAQLWMYVNGDLFSTDGSFKLIVTSYLILQATIFSVPDLRSKLFSIPLFRGLSVFMISSILAFIIFSVVGSVVNSAYGGSFLGISGASLGFILSTAFYVAVIEEFFFRDFLITRFGGDWIWPNIIFAGFHFVVWNMNPLALLIGFFMGLALTWIKFRFSPNDNLANAGVHFAYNCFVMGVFALGILGGSV